jgi:hypothetical protein
MIIPPEKRKPVVFAEAPPEPEPAKQTALIRRPNTARPPPPPPPRPEPELVDATTSEKDSAVYHDEFVTLWPDGSAEFRIRVAAEARIVIKTLKLIKKQVRLQLREINAVLRDVRHQYTDYTRRRGSMIRGCGKVGSIVRLFQSISRDQQRSQLAENVQPLHNQKQALDSLLMSIDQHILRIEAVLLRLQK